MRSFVILCCLATAYAASLGYDYENQGGAPGSQGQHGEAQLSQPLQPSSEVNKEFYTYTAPEHEFDDHAGKDAAADSLKKNLRVIFIKGPENSGLENAALQLAKSAGDDRTAIYVLNKQADISDLANKLKSLNNNNANKPEVHFVKYRTQADAENAQRTIQSQYDALGGPSSSHNGGVAPVLNFASQAPAGGAHGGNGGNGAHGANGALGGSADASGAYLPPLRRF